MRTSRARIVGSVLASSAALVALAGCGGSDSSSDSSSSSSSSAQATTSSESSAAVPSSSASTSASASSSASSTASDSSAAQPSVSTTELDGKLVTTFKGATLKKVPASQLSAGLSMQSQMQQSGQITPASCAAAAKAAAKPPTKMAGGTVQVSGTTMVVALVGDQVDAQVKKMQQMIGACKTMTIKVGSTSVTTTNKPASAPSPNGIKNAVGLESTTNMSSMKTGTLVYFGVKDGVGVQAVAVSPTGAVSSAQKAALGELFAAQAAKV